MKASRAITVTFTADEAQAMLDNTDQEGLSLVGDQYRHVDSAKEKLEAAMRARPHLTLVEPDPPDEAA